MREDNKQSGTNHRVGNCKLISSKAKSAEQHNTACLRCGGEIECDRDESAQKYGTPTPGPACGRSRGQEGACSAE